MAFSIPDRLPWREGGTWDALFPLNKSQVRKPDVQVFLLVEPLCL